MNRAEEIRALNKLTPDELVERSGGRLIILDSLDALHEHFAESIANVIRRNNADGRPTVLIVPFGPTGQYPILKEILHRDRISLADTTLFFMDEYADASGNVVPEDHPTSFRGAMGSFWEELDVRLRPDPKRVLFPHQDNLATLDDMLRDAGGPAVCYGGIGIHGHIAFNEPEPGVANSNSRLVRLNDFTVTINAIRSHVGGDLENFPRHALTLGMQQCLSAKKIRLYCRNDVPDLDWANTVLRLAALGEPGDDYPVTHIRNHADWQVITDRNTAATPQFVL